MEKPEDDLPPFYIDAAQAVVLMHPFPSEAETGNAIEAVRYAILSAVEEERAAIEAIVAPYRHRDTGYDIHQAILERRNRKGA